MLVFRRHFISSRLRLLPRGLLRSAQSSRRRPLQSGSPQIPGSTGTRPCLSIDIASPAPGPSARAWEPAFKALNGAGSAARAANIPEQPLIRAAPDLRRDARGPAAACGAPPGARRATFQRRGTGTCSECGPSDAAGASECGVQTSAGVSEFARAEVGVGAGVGGDGIWMAEGNIGGGGGDRGAKAIAMVMSIVMTATMAMARGWRRQQWRRLWRKQGWLSRWCPMGHMRCAFKVVWLNCVSQELRRPAGAPGGGKKSPAPHLARTSSPAISLCSSYVNYRM